MTFFNRLLGGWSPLSIMIRASEEGAQSSSREPNARLLLRSMERHLAEATPVAGQKAQAFSVTSVGFC